MPPLDSIGGLVSSLLQPGPAAPPNLGHLFQTIDNAGTQQQALINALPPALQQQYAAYKASNAGAGTALQGAITSTGQNLLQQTQANYSPTGPTVQAAENAAKTSIYANVPTQQNAIRQALAATGGFGRGTAAKQLAAPVLQAGTQVNQANENITAQELQQQQAATQQALNTINNMNDQTAQQLFGMTVQQANTILQGNRQDLQQQLAQLINQSQTQTGQLIGAEGAQAQNQYNYNVAQNAQKSNQINAGVNLGTSLLSPGFLAGLGITNAGTPSSSTISGGVGGTTENVPGVGTTWSPATGSY